MYVIGTAGHVDHGKSLLVEALTGIDPDRLREEKARGMTIDLGFAWLTLPGGRTVSVVDVPGHERFIKNMLAGAGGIDLALLVVAADDGVMPQTREHLAILDLLDVRRGVVALTKRDLVDGDWLDAVRDDVAETLAGTTLAGSPIVPCSSLTRAGLDGLLRALDGAVAGLPPKRNIGRPRLPIDRVFTIGGFGTVVTGTLIDGELRVGQEVEVVPGGLRGRVRGLQSHRDKVERTAPGTRTAVNVTGIARDELRRGMVLTVPDAIAPTDVVDVRLRAVDGLRLPLRHNMPVTFHSFADEAPAHVRLLEDDELRPGGTAWAQIKLQAPVCVVRGDRFVLRTPDDTIAGGVVADAAPKRHRRRDSLTIGMLETMLSDDAGNVVLDAVARRPLIEPTVLASELAMSREQIDPLLLQLARDGTLVLLGEGAGVRAVTSGFLHATTRRSSELLAAYHAEHPLRAGMPQEELRARLALDQDAFAALAPMWPDVRPSGAHAALVDFTPAPSARQRTAIDAYLAALRASPESPPAGRAIDPALLAYLVDSGAVVDTGGGIVFEADTFASMCDRVRAHIEAHGSITLAQARDLFGTSRRYAQAILEHMDRLRVTRRRGDARILR